MSDDYESDGEGGIIFKKFGSDKKKAINTTKPKPKSLSKPKPKTSTLTRRAIVLDSDSESDLTENENDIKHSPKSKPSTTTTTSSSKPKPSTTTTSTSSKPKPKSKPATTNTTTTTTFTDDFLMDDIENDSNDEQVLNSKNKRRRSNKTIQSESDNDNNYDNDNDDDDKYKTFDDIKNSVNNNNKTTTSVNNKKKTTNTSTTTGNKINKYDDAAIDRIKQALHHSVVKLSEQKAKELDTNITKETMSSLSELVFSVTKDLISKDLESFAKHANRPSKITVDDVKLLARRNTSILNELLNKEIQRELDTNDKLNNGENIEFGDI